MKYTVQTTLTLAWALALAGGGVSRADPIGTAVTYQGQLKEAGQPYNGTADFLFALFDGAASSTQIGSPLTASDVEVVNGLFTVELDFGSGIFAGEARWLEIEVRTPHDPTDTLPYTLLLPRQELTPAPYSIHAQTAGSVSEGITGSGSANRIARFTGEHSIANSTIYQDGTGSIGIGGEPLSGGMGTPALTVNTGDEYAGVWVGGTRDTAGEDVGGVAFVGDGPGPFTTTYASIKGRIIDSGVTPAQGALLLCTSGAGVGVPEEKVYIMPDGSVGIGTDDPRYRLHVQGGSIVQSSGGPVVGFGKTSVYTDEGTLDANGDFSLSIPDTFYKPWAYDNYMFKVEVFVSLAYYEGPEWENRGAAYSMALIGKERSVGVLSHFREIPELKTVQNAEVDFTYSGPSVGVLRIDVDTNRAVDVDYKVVVKISH